MIITLGRPHMHPFRFVACKDRRTAMRRCPWGVIAAKAYGGFLVFEYVEDYKLWKNQK